MNQVLVLGNSGTGKTSAIRNLNPAETLIITCNKKPLPWAGAKLQYNAGNKNIARATSFVELLNNLNYISKSMPNIKNVIIDDFTHLFHTKTMSKQFMAAKGFDKYNQMAYEAYACVTEIEERDDLFIFYNSHIVEETDAMTGTKSTGMRTAGKVLSNNINLESYFTYIIHTDILESENQREYTFLTNQANGKLAKTPIGCFTDLNIPNDLQIVVDTINKYEKGNI